jgi:hypothetical protein
MVHKEFCMQMFYQIQDDERFMDTVILTTGETSDALPLEVTVNHNYQR